MGVVVIVMVLRGVCSFFSFPSDWLCFAMRDAREETLVM